MNGKLLRRDIRIGRFWLNGLNRILAEGQGDQILRLENVRGEEFDQISWRIKY